MKKIALAAATVMTAASLFSSAAFATTQTGQTEGGDIYRVKNVTQNVDFTDPANATCGDTVQFKVRIHNPGPYSLNNVKVAATLPSGTGTSFSSKVTVTADNAYPTETTDTAGVKTDKTASISYIAGSAELLDAHNNKLSSLGDAVVTSGVNIGQVGVSTEQKRYVQFEAKLDCETTPVTPPTTPTTPVTPVTPATPTTPTVLPSTGIADSLQVVGLIAAAAAAAVYALRARFSNAK